LNAEAEIPDPEACWLLLPSLSVLRAGRRLFAVLLCKLVQAFSTKDIDGQRSLVRGTVGVAIWFAFRITRHLSALERVAATIDADGVVPRLPESGPAELKATARALNSLTAKLKMAAESRMRLVAAAGHDLRTPMTRMRLRAEFLDEEDRALWLNDLEELDHIADSAIQLVREETQRERIQLLRVDEIIGEICQDLASMKASVTILKMEAVTISSAPLALTRAVRNLVINAATHGGGAFVTVGLENDAALITIEDEGPGILEQSMSRVFEPSFPG
jgi:signal transduction histidine kinase